MGTAGAAWWSCCCCCWSSKSCRVCSRIPLNVCDSLCFPSLKDLIMSVVKRLLLIYGTFRFCKSEVVTFQSSILFLVHLNPFHHSLHLLKLVSGCLVYFNVVTIPVRDPQQAPWILSWDYSPPLAQPVSFHEPNPSLFINVRSNNIIISRKRHTQFTHLPLSITESGLSTL